MQSLTTNVPQCYVQLPIPFMVMTSSADIFTPGPGHVFGLMMASPAPERFANACCSHGSQSPPPYGAMSFQRCLQQLQCVGFGGVLLRLYLLIASSPSSPRRRARQRKVRLRSTTVALTHPRAAQTA